MYWVNGYWRESRSEALRIGERDRANVYRVPDSWDEGDLAEKSEVILRWSTIQ